MIHRCVVCGRLASEPCNRPVHDAHYRMWEADAALRVAGGKRPYPLGEHAVWVMLQALRRVSA